MKMDIEIFLMLMLMLRNVTAAMINPPKEEKFDLGLLSTVESLDEATGRLRVEYTYNGAPISPWHDIPFSTRAAPEDEELLSFVCEIPRGSRPKVEIHKSVASNVLLQDLNKDGSLRSYQYSDSIVNYGAISQTWEDPDFLDPDTGLGGDNDPVDVLQLNAASCVRGAVQKVRVLGALAMIDGGETDWKLLVIDVSDGSPWRDVGDIPKERVDEVRNWFRYYKTAEGKPENTFGLNDRAVNRSHAMRVARQTHQHWRELVDGSRNCTFDGETCWVGGGAAKDATKNTEL